ncbi:MAG: M20/M25/M40 family metallo-hydrolase [Cyanobacteria bacterium]|nr:M20/M25/M40 family metallo-hydrolase [Cyanobacteriota bacterium]
MSAPVVDRFMQLAPIDNPSGGEAVIRDFLASSLAKLGLDNQVIDAAGNLLVRVPGDPNKPTLLLSAHMDSVPPCHGIQPVQDASEGRPVIRSAGKTILGADDKSGMAVILEVMSRLKHPNSENNPPSNHPLELLFSTQEEVGLLGAKALDRKQLKADYAYVLDGEGSAGDIFTAGPTQYHFVIECHGRAAHAGIAPEAGLSAIQMMAAVCARLPQGRLGPELTANVGTIEGGKATNVVADFAKIRGEIRTHHEAPLKALLQEYQEICQQVNANFPGGSITFEPLRRYDAFSVSGDHVSVQKAQAVFEANHIPNSLLSMNIGSDAHILNQFGIPAVVLGMGFHFSHSLGEFIYVDELQQITEVVSQLVRGD